MFVTMNIDVTKKLHFIYFIVFVVVVVFLKKKHCSPLPHYLQRPKVKYYDPVLSKCFFNGPANFETRETAEID
uniref:Uncharacterized protein n=1 Tax=Ixodes scapularis TaxID=6945 RepID=A0A4D5S5I2_IXOSC